MSQLNIFQEGSQIPIKVHFKENNSESEAHLHKNLGSFSKQCRKLLALLMDGKRITMAEALTVHEISSISRRAVDLIESGIDVKREFLDGDNFKTYYLEESEIIRLKNL